MGRMMLMANIQMERLRVGGCCDNYQSGRGLLMESAPPLECHSYHSSPVVMQPCSLSSGGGRSSGGGGGRNDGGLSYIEHTVSKFDTLVGVAIKYGVEVVDIKRMNGFTADQQMFALKSLQIPLRRSAHYSRNKHKTSQISNPSMDVCNKSKIIVNGKSEKGDVPVPYHTNDSFDRYFEKLVRRRNGKSRIH